MSIAAAHRAQQRRRALNRATLVTTALIVALGTLAAGRPAADVVADPGPQRTASPVRLLAAAPAAPAHQRSGTKAPRTLGTKFSSSVAGSVVGLRLFRAAHDRSARTGALWTVSGQLLGSVAFPATKQRGWQSAVLAPSVAITPGQPYVVGYFVRGGASSSKRRNLARHPLRLGPLTVSESLKRRGSGMPNRHDRAHFHRITPVFAADTATAAGVHGTRPPVDSTSTLKDFPNAANTGVPAGTALTPYTGPQSVTRDGTVIDAKTITGDLLIKADNVTITSSQLNGRLSSDFGGSVTVVDSSINGGNQETFPAVSYTDITLRRVDVYGGQHSVQCSENCTIVDSWLHDQYLPATSAGHVNAFISNGGNHLVLRHNTVHCTVPLTKNDGGCSGDVSLFGDFDPISDVTIDNNYFRANQQSISYCLYAGYNPGKPYGSNPTRVTVTNNVFERGANNKCGVYGPVTSFLNANGNVWTNNIWQDTRTAIAPAE